LPTSAPSPSLVPGGVGAGCWAPVRPIAAMEFPFDLLALVGAPQGHDGPCVGYVDERALSSSSRGTLATVLEEMGHASAVAQGLRKPVTFGSNLGDQRVYLLVDGHVALGLLKVGRKRLFVAAAPARSGFADVQDAFTEIEPVCALDFYVHERCQRNGLGKQLFEAMLLRERVVPAELGYDRPSPKLMGFLKSHYGLHKHQPQSNNFVVFENYFNRSMEADRHDDRSIRPSDQHFERRTPVAAAGGGSTRCCDTPTGRSSGCVRQNPSPICSGIGSRAVSGGVEECFGRRGAGPVRDLFGESSPFGASPVAHHHRHNLGAVR